MFSYRLSTLYATIINSKLNLIVNTSLIYQNALNVISLICMMSYKNDRSVLINSFIFGKTTKSIRLYRLLHNKCRPLYTSVDKSWWFRLGLSLLNLVHKNHTHFCFMLLTIITLVVMFTKFQLIDILHKTDISYSFSSPFTW